MSIDEHPHVALPKLYGAPAYARPRRIVADSPRPIDPDDLPISAYQTDEERQVAEALRGTPYTGAEHDEDDDNGHGLLRARPFRLRALASRVLRGN